MLIGLRVFILQRVVNGQFLYLRSTALNTGQRATAPASDLERRENGRLEWLTQSYQMNVKLKG
jgi:hypothetical protein